MSSIKPSESRGYIAWSKTPNTKYVINLLERDLNGNYYTVGQNSTTNNYARLIKDNYTATTGLYYTITAYNSLDGSYIGESDVQVYIGDGPVPSLVCDRKCNGSTYAWKLFITETTYGNTQMALSSTLDYYDFINDMAVPFYFAMPMSSYNSLPLGHPYNSVTGYTVPGGTSPVYQYKRIQITPSTPGGPFLTPGGDAVNSGYLMEKKMNQFDFMHGSIALGNPDLSINCDPGVVVSDGNTWMWYYNSYVDTTSWQAIPTSVQPFAYTVPTQLECDRGQVPGAPSPSSEVGSISSVIFTGCEGQSVSICDYLTCLGIDCNGNGYSGSLQGMIIQQYNDVFTPIVLDLENNTGNFNLIQSLPTGLYEMTVFGANGSVLPFFFENINEQGTTQNRDFVTMTLTPTVIQNDELSFTISTEKDLNATVSIQDLGGTVYHTEALQLSSTLDTPLLVTINTANIPYNQIKVNLIFDDGSVIQKTAVKVN